MTAVVARVAVMAGAGAVGAGVAVRCGGLPAMRTATANTATPVTVAASRVPVFIASLPAWPECRWLGVGVVRAAASAYQWAVRREWEGRLLVVGWAGSGSWWSVVGGFGA